MSMAPNEQPFLEIRTYEPEFAPGKYGAIIDMYNGTVYETLWRHSVEEYATNVCVTARHGAAC